MIRAAVSLFCLALASCAPPEPVVISGPLVDTPRVPAKSSSRHPVPQKDDKANTLDAVEKQLRDLRDRLSPEP